MTKRRYIPTEDWERWCSKKKRKVRTYRKILEENKKHLKSMSDWIEASRTRKNRFGTGRTKEGALLQKQTDHLIKDLEEHKRIISETRDKIVGKVTKWVEYAQENIPQTDTDFVEMFSVMQADNDNSLLWEFVSYAEDKIHDWESSEDESSSNEEEESPRQRQRTEQNPATPAVLSLF